MDINQLTQKTQLFFKNLPITLKEFPAKFQRMSLGEQIAYGCIGLGVILIIVSLFLF